MERLPDVLQNELKLVFVGTAAGQRSADVGHYYAHPGNRFWRTIHETGITPRQYQPHEFPSLLDLGIGLKGRRRDQPGSMPFDLITASACGAARNLTNALATSLSLLATEVAAEK
jgi:G:T/U-mismatch repair DNA glycosylase